MNIRIPAVFLLMVLWSAFSGCADDSSCGPHQHSYRFSCVCDMNYIMVADTCIPLETPVGWCPGDLVCTQLANDYMACTNADGTLPGNPTEECPDYAAAENNSSWLELNGEVVCILHCGACGIGECQLGMFDSDFGYFCSLVYANAICKDNSDCGINHSCYYMPGSSEKYCFEHCSVPWSEDGDADTD